MLIYWNEEEKKKIPRYFWCNTGNLFKIINPYKTHRGFEFVEGLNTDRREFYPFGVCQKGGIYFASAYIFEYASLYTRLMCDKDNKETISPLFICDVTIPDNEPVWVEDEKAKAHNIILTNWRPLNCRTMLDIMQKHGVYLYNYMLGDMRIMNSISEHSYNVLKRHINEGVQDD